VLGKLNYKIGNLCYNIKSAEYKNLIQLILYISIEALCKLEILGKINLSKENNVLECVMIL